MDKVTSLVVAREPAPPTFASRESADPIRTIARAALAKAHHMRSRRSTPEAVAREHWPFDEDVQLLLRAATVPRDMTNAAALVAIGQAILPMLTPYSAAAKLFAAGLSVTLGPEGAIMVPGFGGANVHFVADGAPKPAVQPLSASTRLDPHKLAGIAVATDELLASASAETLIQNMLAESSGPALDAAVFSSSAATPSAPAGLLHGITPLTPSAATDFYSAFTADLAALAGAIAPVAGAGRVAIVMNPAQFYGVAVLVRPEGDLLMLATNALPAGNVMVIALNGLVSATSPPEFEMGTQTTLTMDDAPPVWPNGPVMSMFQTASTAIKMVEKVSWAARSPLAVAAVNGVKW